MHWEKLPLNYMIDAGQGKADSLLKQEKHVEEQYKSLIREIEKSEKNMSDIKHQLERKEKNLASQEEKLKKLKNETKEQIAKDTIDARLKKIHKEQKEIQADLPSVNEELQFITEKKANVVKTYDALEEIRPQPLEYLVHILEDTKYGERIKIKKFIAYSDKQAKQIAKDNWGTFVIEVERATPKAEMYAEKIAEQQEVDKRIKKETKTIDDPAFRNVSIPMKELPVEAAVYVNQYKRKPGKRKKLTKKRIKKSLTAKKLKKSFLEYWETH